MVSNGRLRHHHFGTPMPCGFNSAPSGRGSPFHSLDIIMLKLLSRLLGRDLTAPTEPPVDENVSEREIWRELHPSAEKKTQLRKFLRLITSHLSQAESRRLTRIAADSLEDACSAYDALSESILGENGQKRGKWIFIQVDWKAEDELEWQANELLSTRGVTEQWHHDWRNNPTGVPTALINLSDWLDKYELSLLHVDTESDCYCSFIVRQDEAESAIALAKEAELIVENRQTFLEKNI